MNDSNYWRKCTTCKHPIGFGALYYVCSVSTCNRKRSQMVFCNIRCWDAHVPVMNHREASAEERRAPSAQQAQAQARAEASESSSAASGSDILVVASRVKSYILESSGMNTSAGTLEALSTHVREIAKKAIERAKDAGRQTVMARDIKMPEIAAPRRNVVIRRRPQP